jgi:hypothetical protein
MFGKKQQAATQLLSKVWKWAAAMRILKNVGLLLLFVVVAFLPALGALAVRTDG